MLKNTSTYKLLPKHAVANLGNQVSGLPNLSKFAFTVGSISLKGLVGLVLDLDKYFFIN